MEEFTTNIYTDGSSLSFSEFYYLLNEKLSELFEYNGEWEFDETTNFISFKVYFLSEDLWEAANLLEHCCKELEEEQITITWSKPANFEY
jgi:hypothetical protein